MNSDNFATLLEFRDIDFLTIFEYALLDVELDLGFEEVSFDFEEYFEEEGHRNPVWEAMACRFSGVGDFDKIKEMFSEVHTFEGIGVTGCRRGRVLLMSLPLLVGEGLQREVLLALGGVNCRNLSRTRDAISKLVANMLVEEVLFELGEE